MLPVAFHVRLGAYAHETSFQHAMEKVVIASDWHSKRPKDVEVRGWDAAAGSWATQV